MTWTAERIDTLKRMVADGAEYSKIAKELGVGITRNAVIGKAKRLGLCAAHPRRQNPKIKRAPRSLGANWRARVAQRIRRADKHPVVPVEQLPQPAALAPDPVLFLARESGQCAWIVSPEGTPVEQLLVCGAGCPLMPDAQTCADHRKIGYTASYRDFDRLAAA